MPRVVFRMMICFMKEKLYNLFLAPTDSGALQFLRYLFVGGSAFIADSGALWLLERVGLHYLFAGVPAFIIGLTVNYIMSKWLVFKNDSISPAVEFLIYGVIGVIGLGLTELIMHLLTEYAHLYFMISKVIAAAAVTLWNYFGKKAIYAIKSKSDKKG